MTATDELRRMLDERGVEYETDDEDGCEFTEWVANGLEWEADSRGELVSLMPVMLITPEQAIAATLGRGECHDLAETPKYGDKTRFECSACGYEYSAVGGFGCDYGDEPDFRYCPNCGREVVTNG